jgi:hypothetical protein
MSAEQAESSAQYPPGLSELRAEVERLRAEVDSLRQAQSDQAEAEAAKPQMAGQPAARLAGSAVVGSPVIASQYNTAEAPTMLQATNPTITLGLLNYAQGTSTTGAPVGLYALARGIGIIVSAFGVAPSPVVSKAVQAFCELGVAVFADSRDNTAVYAHTTNGQSAIVADQASANPRSVAVAALGGSGVGLYASGETAAVQLGRSSVAGPPTTGFHEAGELSLDANADLYLCKASGTPGTWNLIG